MKTRSLQCRTGYTAIAPLLMLGLALAAPASANAAEEPLDGESPGKALYNANCVQCHGSEIYTRQDRRIQSFSQLENQVQQCETALELKWFEDDVMDVASLLNDRYYHFAR